MYQLIHRKTKESHLCEKTYIGGIVHYVNKDLEIIACVEPDKGYSCVIDEVAVKTEQFSICYPASLKDKEQQLLEIGFYNGYQQAQFLSPFTLEEMVNFANWIADVSKHGHNKQLFEAMLRYKVKSVEELIRIWQSQKIKTLYYE